MRGAVEAAVRILAREVPGLIAVYRHGSFGTVRERPASDLDLALLAAAPVPLETRLALSAAIGEATGREADLADLRAASVVFRARVIGGGDCVFEADETARREFEMIACSAYAMLNEERAGIVADARDRGAIHGR
ncbi:MAG: nucleotidyltransferase domain-containing protein [Proteobacteria bacterium]|jgi:predicted nucleotidyltransferase|nr:nucleotidyltransferase domain-containing protein [Pseudomonadota bacterium]